MGIRFLGNIAKGGNIFPIDRAITFVDKFLNEINDKNQLWRFLDSLNYITISLKT